MNIYFLPMILLWWYSQHFARRPGQLTQLIPNWFIKHSFNYKWRDEGITILPVSRQSKTPLKFFLQGRWFICSFPPRVLLICFPFLCLAPYCICARLNVSLHGATAQTVDLWWLVSMILKCTNSGNHAKGISFLLFSHKRQRKVRGGKGQR